MSVVYRKLVTVLLIFALIHNYGLTVAYAGGIGSIINKPGEIVQTVEVPDIHKISSMTVINGRLHVVPYISENAPSVTTATGIIFDILEDGQLKLSKDHFIIDTGHVNTIDYDVDNDCLLIGNGGGSSSTQPNRIYVFNKASSYRNYVMANKNMITIDVSKDDWGKQLNCIWINTDLICCITNYEKNNMEAYAVGNPNMINGNTRSFIRIVQLGKGIMDLGNGELLNVGENEYNGTYRVLKTYERPYGKGKANNDCMWYENQIWERWNEISTYGFNIFITELSDQDDSAPISEITIPFITKEGEPLSAEGEGICYYNGYIYVSAANIIAVVQA